MNKQPGFQADTTLFSSLRENVRELVRQAESNFRQAASPLLEMLPTQFRTPSVTKEIRFEFPARLIQGLSAYFIRMNELEIEGEKLLARAKAESDSAGLPGGSKLN